jgi:hypothetical protein
MSKEIPGYDLGAAPRSPVTMDELRAIEQSTGWTEEDGQWLSEVARYLVPQAEQMVDRWRSVIGAQPHLAKVFFGPDGKTDDRYKAAVKKRFVQWVVDLCTRPRDQAWLDYQEEIGQRHTPARKNATDGAHTPNVVPLRYLVAFTAVVNTSVREFLKDTKRSSEEVTKMQDAWSKAMLLHLALWTRAYAQEGLW